MEAIATVNYHINSEQPQSYYIDANGEKGRIVSPELIPTRVKVQNVRDSSIDVDFWNDSVAFIRSVSSVQHFEVTGDWKPRYDQELCDLLATQIGAKEVIVFDHTLRVDDPNAGRKPARNVHSDYSVSGAHARLRDLLGTVEVDRWEEGHFGFVNVWRPVTESIKSAPLGFVRPKTVSARDWLQLELIYPDRVGQIMGLVANKNHEWLYLSEMSPEEVAVFNIYDNQGLSPVGHSALDLVDDVQNHFIRRSIESRTLVRY